MTTKPLSLLHGSPMPTGVLIETVDPSGKTVLLGDVIGKGAKAASSR